MLLKEWYNPTFNFVCLSNHFVMFIFWKKRSGVIHSIFWTLSTKYCMLKYVSETIWPSGFETVIFCFEIFEMLYSKPKRLVNIAATITIYIGSHFLDNLPNKNGHQIVYYKTLLMIYPKSYISLAIVYIYSECNIMPNLITFK